MVGIDYENMTYFYNHHVSYCKRDKVAPTQKEQELINKRKPRQVQRKAFVQTKDNMNVQNKETEIINLEDSNFKCKKPLENNKQFGG